MSHCDNIITVNLNFRYNLVYNIKHFYTFLNINCIFDHFNNGISIAITTMMKTVIISNDNELINIIKTMSLIPENQLGIYSDKADALEIMSHVCTEHPSTLIIDDDFVKPESAHVLNAIRKVNNNVKIIFISSDSSVELGREVSKTGILYHAVKPVDVNEINDLFQSINK